MGHSNRPLEAFLALLEENRIESLCDVRRFPGSRRYPHFSREALAASLAKEKIGYLHLPNLGGRRPADPNSPNTAWRHKAFRGYADYMATPAFAEGIAALTGEAARKRTVILCAEALWWQCHRALIADFLKTAGWEVIHILGPGKTQIHPFTSAARMIAGKLSYAAPQESFTVLLPRCAADVR